MSKQLQKIISELGTTDIYLIDQIMKERYRINDIILDAGCGHGRNIELLIMSGITVYGIDINPDKIQYCQSKFPHIKDQFKVQELVHIDFEDNTFNHIISSAVFHFAESTEHFMTMFAEHVRVLKSGGTIFIRMTSLFGLPVNTAREIGKGRYYLPEYGERFLITYSLIQNLLRTFHLSLAEPIKTVNVQDNRAMSILVFQKN